MSKHNIEKNYYEFLAKLILENACPEKYHDIILQDKPDLVNFDGRGIEVTRSMYYGSGEASHMFQIIKNHKLKTANQRALGRLIQLGYNTIKSNTDQIVGYALKAGIWVTTSELETSYKSKISKLDHYGPNTDLFIFASSQVLYEWSDIEIFLERINLLSKNNVRNFNRVFIYQYKKLFICDTNNCGISQVDMDRKTLDIIIEEAFEFANKNY